MAGQAHAYTEEIAFLKRQCSTKVKWKAKPIIEQIVSESLLLTKAREVAGELKTAFRAKCLKKGKLPENIVKIHEAKQGAWVIIKVPLLREVFGEEIDGFAGGGGGRKMKQSPILTQLMRR